MLVNHSLSQQQAGHKRAIEELKQAHVKPFCPLPCPAASLACGHKLAESRSCAMFHTRHQQHDGECLQYLVVPVFSLWKCSLVECWLHLLL